MAATYPLIVDRVEPISTYPSDKASGAGETPANTGDGVSMHVVRMASW